MTGTATIACLLLAAGPARAEDAPKVEVVEVPGGGIQPAADVDASGTVHLVFLRGDPAASEVWYASWKPGEAGLGPATRVDSGPGSAVAMGTVRGAQVAAGREGRVHVAWNGATKATPANPLGGSPLLYARSGPSGGGFEPQRNLMTRSTGLDGGASIAADGSGRVFVAWHGQPRGSSGEANRRVWVARCGDDGATFGPEAPAEGVPAGACACCGTRALVDGSGALRVLYRGASGGGAERDAVALTSRDGGRAFEPATLQPWRIDACPMSTFSLAPEGPGAVAAWEARGEVSFARLDASGRPGSPPASPPGGDGSRKHPSVAVNGRGEVLLAWAEGTAWQRGGALAWQAFDRSGRPVGPPGRVDRGVPAWGLPAVVARPGGGFAIIH